MQLTTDNREDALSKSKLEAASWWQQQTPTILAKQIIDRQKARVSHETR